MEKKFTEIATIEAIRLLLPLQRLNSGPNVYRFTREIGFDLGNIEVSDDELDSNELFRLLAEALEAVMDFAEAETGTQAESAIKEIIIKIPLMIVEITSIAEALERKIKQFRNTNQEVIGVSLAEVSGLLATRMINHLLYNHLQRYHQRIFSILHVLGLSEIVIDDAGMPIRTIQWKRILDLYTDPGGLINTVYEWKSEFLGDKFLQRVEVLLRAFLIPGGMYTQNESMRIALGREIGKNQEIRIPIHRSGIWPESYSEIGINLSPIPCKDDENKAGLFHYPYFMAGANIDLDFDENWKFHVKGILENSTNIGLEIRPPSKIRLVSNIFDGSSTLEDLTDSHIEIGATKKKSNDNLTLLFGSQTGSKLGYRDIEFNLFLGLENGEYIFASEMNVDDFTLGIDTKNGDGFIQRILSNLKVESISDLTIGISSKEGFYFKGSSTLDITIPIHKELGPVYLDSAKVGIGFNEGINILLASTFSVKLGPITGTVKELGLEIPIGFPEDYSGNFGPVKLEGVKFHPPSGAGLVVNSSGLTGGGFLEHNDGNYTGILALKFADFTLTAVGLINTMPEDYSLLVIITAEFTPEIELSFGFTLKGVGGLIGVNRTIDTDYLREGLRAKTLDSILFPENPIRNASMVISDFSQGFPVCEGRFVIGPMVKIGWGGGMISADICVLVDLPSPVRIVLLGQLSAILPPPNKESGDEPQRKVVEFNLDVLGEWNTDKGTLAIDATLYDSKILSYPLFGDAAIRMKTGSNAYFAMSVGGFHPAFSPPPAFPSLRRLDMSLADTSRLEISCKLFMAITPNTLQFGSRLQLWAKYSGVTAEGHLAFDCLFYLSPFSFTAHMDAGVSVKYKGKSLASVDLDLTLSGPTPWNAAGEASFKIAFWEIDFDFDKTWGNSRKRLLDDVNPFGYLKRDLEDNANWGVVFSGVRNVESFKPITIDEAGSVSADTLIMHPAGMIEIREKVLPLDHVIDLYGGARVKGYNKFTIPTLTISPAQGDGTAPPIPTAYLDEEFATAQYFEKTAAQKLSQPSFEPMPGAAVPKELGLKIPQQQTSCTMEFENILIDNDRISRKSDIFTAYPRNRVLNDLLASKTKRYAASGKPFHREGTPHVTVEKDKYFLVDKDTLDIVSATGNTGLSLTRAGQLLQKLSGDHEIDINTVDIVPEYDLEMVV